jgi:flagellar assembly factor FliW
MPVCKTKYHGILEYEPDSEIHFPGGLFGFERETHFVPIEQPFARPIIFLQSLNNPDLCFVTLPVLVVDRGYTLTLDDHDLRSLGLPVARQPRIGEDVLCLVTVVMQENGPTTANLLAPLVMNLRTRVAVQAIGAGAAYSHRHPFLESAEELVCS